MFKAAVSTLRRGDICLVDLADNVGSEQGGIRPAVIVQNDVGNNYSPTTLICPLTSRNKQMNTTHVGISPDEAAVVKPSVILCEQARVIDKTRIKKKLGKIESQRKIEEINKRIAISFGLI